MKPSSVPLCTRRDLFRQLVNPFKRDFSSNQPPTISDRVSMSSPQVQNGIPRRLFLGFMALIGLESLGLKLMGCGSTIAPQCGEVKSIGDLTPWDLSLQLLEGKTTFGFKGRIPASGEIRPEGLLNEGSSLSLGFILENFRITGIAKRNKEGLLILKELEATEIIGISEAEQKAKDLAQRNPLGYVVKIPLSVLVANKICDVFENEKKETFIRYITLDFMGHQAVEWIEADRDGNAKCGEVVCGGPNEIAKNGNRAQSVPANLKQAYAYYSVDGEGNYREFTDVTKKIPKPIPLVDYGDKKSPKPDERMYKLVRDDDASNRETFPSLSSLTVSVTFSMEKETYVVKPGQKVTIPPSLYSGGGLQMEIVGNATIVDSKGQFVILGNGDIYAGNLIPQIEYSCG